MCCPPKLKMKLFFSPQPLTPALNIHTVNNCNKRSTQYVGFKAIFKAISQLSLLITNKTEEKPFFCFVLLLYTENQQVNRVPL